MSPLLWAAYDKYDRGVSRRLTVGEISERDFGRILGKSRYARLQVLVIASVTIVSEAAVSSRKSVDINLVRDYLLRYPANWQGFEGLFHEKVARLFSCCIPEFRSQPFSLPHGTKSDGRIPVP